MTDVDGYPIGSCPESDDFELRIMIWIGPVNLSLTLADAIRVRDSLDQTLNNHALLQLAREHVLDDDEDPDDDEDSAAQSPERL